jgi:hypothetical protein
MEKHTPPRVAQGMTLFPSKLYEKEVAEPSRVGRIGSPLVYVPFCYFRAGRAAHASPPLSFGHSCFDLDGTVSIRRALLPTLPSLTSPLNSSTLALPTTLSTILSASLLGDRRCHSAFIVHFSSRQHALIEVLHACRYLRTLLNWLLNVSPFSVAIWTGSQKATAVRCLNELNLGIVGPDLGQFCCLPKLNPTD